MGCKIAGIRPSSRRPIYLQCQAMDLLAKLSQCSVKVGDGTRIVSLLRISATRNGFLEIQESAIQIFRALFQIFYGLDPVRDAP